MRLWNTNPTKLCRNHLLGEHAEMHMFVGCINKGMSIKGYVDKGLVDTSLIRKRHDQLAEEMARRGFSHKSPFPDYDIPAQGSVDAKANEAELAHRCPACRALLKKG